MQLVPQVCSNTSSSRTPLKRVLKHFLSQGPCPIPSVWKPPVEWAVSQTQEERAAGILNSSILPAALPRLGDAARLRAHMFPRVPAARKGFIGGMVVVLVALGAFAAFISGRGRRKARRATT